jgi:LDH2 family malate/lactate/ureidoglycolate dehydrogenase
MGSRWRASSRGPDQAQTERGLSDGTPSRRFWARRIADAGLVGVVMSQSPEAVAPHGSFEPVLGTNPIAVGIPADGAPVVIDMATSAHAWYSLLEAQRSGRPVADDVGYTAHGEPTTDPGQILQGGAMRSFDR